MAALWVVQVRIRDASHVDVAWAVLIACAAILYALLADGDVGASRARSGAGLRLGIPARRVPLLQPHPRQGGGRPLPGAPREVGRVGEPQLLLVLPVPGASSSSSSRCRSPSSPSTRTRASASSRGSGSRSGRSATWGRSSPIASSHSGARTRRTRGRPRASGLWSWSRHPNYFFEWVNWCGNALVATTAPLGWIAWIVPAGLLFLLFRVTGIPATEAQALRSRADYAEYQRTTSVLRSARHPRGGN